MSLNPIDGDYFLSVYIDDVLVYSRILEEHLEHLKHHELVIQRIERAGLKLETSKCCFVKRRWSTWVTYSILMD